MLPQFICNLIATLSYPPWTRELDWDLHTTIEWEKRVPFHAYVQRDAIAPGTSKQGSLFPQFNALPAELQLRILALCPPNTLFQVMRASSLLRVEASKLFWANPKAAFLIEALWLLEGGHPGYTFCDVPFLRHVQEVEINYCPGIDDTICPGEKPNPNTRLDLISRFWTSLVQRLPNVRRVVIVQNWATPSCWKDGEPVPYPLRMLIQACPAGIEVVAIVLEENASIDPHAPLPRTKKWQRSLYQPAATGGWVKSHQPWHNTTILVPAKSFNGPVGEFQRLQYEIERIRYQRYGLGPLMIEALDRYHFDKGRCIPFPCPMPSCNTVMARAGDWIVHAVELHYQAGISGQPLVGFPEQLRAVFKERADALAEKDNEVGRGYMELREDWNTHGKQRRREIQRRWIDQLKNDPAWETGEKPGESRLWTRFWQSMHPTMEFYY
jgi:hypothetical protein